MLAADAPCAPNANVALQLALIHGFVAPEESHAAVESDRPCLLEVAAREAVEPVMDLPAGAQAGLMSLSTPCSLWRCLASRCLTPQRQCHPNGE